MPKVIKKSKTLKDILRLAAWLEHFLDLEMQTISHGQAIDDDNFLVLFEALQLVRRAEKKLCVFHEIWEATE